MKKLIGSALLVFVTVLFLTGCGSSKDNNFVCTYSSDQSASGYKLKSEYKVYSDGEIVNKVVTVETVESTNTSVLSYFESALKEQYKSNDNKYGGYSYNITKTDDTVISEVTIDYTKMDIEKFIEDNEAVKAYVNDDNQLTVEGVKKMYKSIGATCK